MAVDPSNGHCFRYVDAYNAWSTASEACALWGGHLATVTSAAEHTFVAKFLSATGAANPYVWIGAHRVGSTWSWDGGEPLDFTAWDVGQPDDPGLGEACAELLQANAWKWHDAACDGAQAYLCESP